MLWSPCGVCEIWNMEYVIGCVRIYACAYLLLNVLRVDRHVVFGVARLVLSIHDKGQMQRKWFWVRNNAEFEITELELASKQI